MRYSLTKKAEKQLLDVPAAIRRAFGKQVNLLVSNFRHPSLDAKRYKETNQARVNLSWRFYFDIEGDCYVITRVCKHL